MSHDFISLLKGFVKGEKLGLSKYISVATYQLNLRRILLPMVIKYFISLKNRKIT